MADIQFPSGSQPNFNLLIPLFQNPATDPTKMGGMPKFGDKGAAIAGGVQGLMGKIGGMAGGGGGGGAKRGGRIKKNKKKVVGEVGAEGSLDPNGQQQYQPQADPSGAALGLLGQTLKGAFRGPYDGGSSGASTSAPTDFGNGIQSPVITREQMMGNCRAVGGPVQTNNQYMMGEPQPKPQLPMGGLAVGGPAQGGNPYMTGEPQLPTPPTQQGNQSLGLPNLGGMGGLSSPGFDPNLQGRSTGGLMGEMQSYNTGEGGGCAGGGCGGDLPSSPFIGGEPGSGPTINMPGYDGEVEFDENGHMVGWNGRQHAKGGKAKGGLSSLMGEGGQQPQQGSADMPSPLSNPNAQTPGYLQNGDPYAALMGGGKSKGGPQGQAAAIMSPQGLMALDQLDESHCAPNGSGKAMRAAIAAQGNSGGAGGVDPVVAALGGGGGCGPGGCPSPAGGGTQLPLRAFGGPIGGGQPMGAGGASPMGENNFLNTASRGMAGGMGGGSPLSGARAFGGFTPGGQGQQYSMGEGQTSPQGNYGQQQNFGGGYPRYALGGAAPGGRGMITGDNMPSPLQDRNNPMGGGSSPTSLMRNSGGGPGGASKGGAMGLDPESMKAAQIADDTHCDPNNGQCPFPGGKNAGGGMAKALGGGSGGGSGGGLAGLGGGSSSGCGPGGCGPNASFGGGNAASLDAGSLGGGSLGGGADLGGASLGGGMDVGASLGGGEVGLGDMGGSLGGGGDLGGGLLGGVLACGGGACGGTNYLMGETQGLRRMATGGSAGSGQSAVMGDSLRMGGTSPSPQQMVGQSPVQQYGYNSSAIQNMMGRLGMPGGGGGGPDGYKQTPGSFDAISPSMASNMAPGSFDISKVTGGRAFGGPMDEAKDYMTGEQGGGLGNIGNSSEPRPEIVVPKSGNDPYVVGQNGPEIHTPKEDSFVIPNPKTQMEDPEAAKNAQLGMDQLNKNSNNKVGASNSGDYNQYTDKLGGNSFNQQNQQDQQNYTQGMDQQQSNVTVPSAGGAGVQMNQPRMQYNALNSAINKAPIDMWNKLKTSAPQAAPLIASEGFKIRKRLGGEIDLSKGSPENLVNYAQKQMQLTDALRPLGQLQGPAREAAYNQLLPQIKQFDSGAPDKYSPAYHSANLALATPLQAFSSVFSKKPGNGPQQPLEQGMTGDQMAQKATGSPNAQGVGLYVGDGAGAYPAPRTVDGSQQRQPQDASPGLQTASVQQFYNPQSNKVVPGSTGPIFPSGGGNIGQDPRINLAADKLQRQSSATYPGVDYQNKFFGKNFDQHYASPQDIHTNIDRINDPQGMLMKSQGYQASPGNPGMYYDQEGRLVSNSQGLYSSNGQLRSDLSGGIGKYTAPNIGPVRDQSNGQYHGYSPTGRNDWIPYSPYPTPNDKQLSAMTMEVGARYGIGQPQGGYPMNPAVAQQKEEAMYPEGRNEEGYGPSAPVGNEAIQNSQLGVQAKMLRDNLERQGYSPVQAQQIQSAVQFQGLPLDQAIKTASPVNNQGYVQGPGRGPNEFNPTGGNIESQLRGQDKAYDQFQVDRQRGPVPLNEDYRDTLIQAMDSEEAKNNPQLRDQIGQILSNDDRIRQMSSQYQAQANQPVTPYQFGTGPGGTYDSVKDAPSPSKGLLSDVLDKRGSQEGANPKMNKSSEITPDKDGYLWDPKKKVYREAPKYDANGQREPTRLELLEKEKTRSNKDEIKAGAEYKGSGYRYSADGTKLEPIPGGPAAKVSMGQTGQNVMMDNAHNALKGVEDLVFQKGADGKIDYNKLDRKTLIFVSDSKSKVAGAVQNFATGGKSGELAQKIYTAVDATLRVETGAQQSESEIWRQSLKYLPQGYDSPQTARNKLNALNNYVEKYRQLVTSGYQSNSVDQQIPDKVPPTGGTDNKGLLEELQRRGYKQVNGKWVKG